VSPGAPDRPVVLVAEELAPSAVRLLEASLDVRHVDGTDRAALLGGLAEAQAVVVRSATRLDAEALAAGPRLRVVGRAGIGLDNIDVAAATARGVMVVNAPTSNVVSAAEHAVALLLACARNIAPASAALKAGRWNRSAFTGVELADKVVGILGLGRVGVLVAQRLAAFGVDLLAYDPYVSAARAAQIGVRLVGLPEILATSDFLTVHLPRTPETVGLIGAAELAAAKPGLRIVNAARGGIVVEQALAEALASGTVAGAGIDVFETEPTTASPLFGYDSVVVTPHLGASTVEAQDKAGLAVAQSVLLALQGEFVPDAVNVQAVGVVAEEVRPALALAEMLGQVFTGLAGGLAASLTVDVRGEITEHDVSVLTLAALRGVFAAAVEEPVSYVNAPLLAAERGLAVELVTDGEAEAFRSQVGLRGVLADGTPVSVSGTLSGRHQVHKLVEINGFDVDLRAGTHLLVLRYADRPGIVGAVGAMLGDAHVNIAGAQVSRREAGGEALMVLTVDEAVDPQVLAEIAEIIGASAARAVDIDGAGRA
jgi:D-3-phosphoglycerate dehydrogenase